MTQKHRFQGSEVLRHRGFEAPRFRGTEVSRHRGFEATRFEGNFCAHRRCISILMKLNRLCFGRSHIPLAPISRDTSSFTHIYPSLLSADAENMLYTGQKPSVAVSESHSILCAKWTMQLQTISYHMLDNQPVIGNGHAFIVIIS